ncbi:methionyl-tRNA formyltransferase [Zoogloea sp.]|uniref:methionyl-tRNA formyltransferase n=1 Tax=Zoogloea sp. TaxID=49181 RepID=UPI0025850E4E|nr:methionyl-tRNA formyltransferase [Zoogloea sp.]MDD2670013.1 methionyl-tRNA formyltransferase [Zoogloea sp.]
MKIAFAGTPEFAAVALESILAAGFEVTLVLTQPDRPAGRGMQLQPSPVKQVALAANIPVHQPEKLRTPEQQAPLAEAGVDVLVVAAYGIILPQAVLDMPRYGCLNIHGSLLPRWRGAAPIHRAIQAGDFETGITIMQMDAGLDTGPMLLKRAEAIHPDDTTASLHDRLAWLGADMIVEALQALPDGLTATPQPAEGVTYAAKIGKAEAAVDWTRPAVEIERTVRAFNPFPGALATYQNTPIKLWRARAIDASGTPGEVLLAEAAGVIVACGEGSLCITELQKPGAKRMPTADFLRGMPIAVGSRFE